MSDEPLVLLVEDDGDICEVYATVLQAAELRVVTAGDGQQALRLALELRPDLIVTDMRLPIMDGWTLTRRLKANASTRHIPIIAISGQYLMQELSDRSRAAGFVSCLLKPCAPEDLTREVKMVLSPADVRLKA